MSTYHTAVNDMRMCRTVKIRSRKRNRRTGAEVLGVGEVSLARLKREIEAAAKAFWASRAHLHYQASGRGPLDFHRRNAA